MASDSNGGRFPAVPGRNLAGTKYALPGDFEGELNLAIVAFRRRHQADVDTWIPVGDRLEAGTPGFRYYELPVIDRLYRPGRAFIDGGMRAAIADRATRERTITLYVDARAFRQALEISSKETIHVLLVDPEGVVHWRMQGRRTDAAEHTLQMALDERLQSG
jgi:hypothetical protein